MSQPYIRSFSTAQVARSARSLAAYLGFQCSFRVRPGSFVVACASPSHATVLASYFEDPAYTSGPVRLMLRRASYIITSNFIHVQCR